MNSFLLKAEHIGLKINQRQILQDINLNIKAGEIVTLIGPNGSGKTTLVKVLLGLIESDEGHLQKKEKLVIGYMPQKLHIDAVLPMTVMRFLKMGIKVSEDEVQKMSTSVGVNTLLDQALQSISGGEFLLDEPAQGVDINGQQQLYQLISNIRDEYGCGVLMISHDLHLVMEATDQVLCLNTHICCSGHPEAVSQHPEYLRLFGSSLDGMAVYTHHHNHSHELSGDVVACQREGCKHNHG